MLYCFRVTWLASEGLTNYLRRVIQDEKSREREKEFSTIPENNRSGPKTDSKGRRLSYQRAVSGEDQRYLDSLHRRKQLIPENSEVSNTPSLMYHIVDLIYPNKDMPKGDETSYLYTFIPKSLKYKKRDQMRFLWPFRPLAMVFGLLTTIETILLNILITHFT